LRKIRLTVVNKEAFIFRSATGGQLLRNLYPFPGGDTGSFKEALFTIRDMERVTFVNVVMYAEWMQEVSLFIAENALPVSFCSLRG